MKGTLLRVVAFCAAGVMLLGGLSSCNDGKGKKKGEIKTELVTHSSGIQFEKYEMDNPLIKVLSPHEQTQFLEGENVNTFFKENFGGEIDMTVVAAAELYTTMTAGINSGEPVDVVTMHRGWPHVAVQGSLESVDDIMNFDLDIFKHLKGDYESNTTASTTICRGSVRFSTIAITTKRFLKIMM